MERLTGYSESHNEGFLEKGCPENPDCLRRDCNDCSVGKAINKLAEYENLGYTPSELKEIIEANQITRAWEREKELEAYKNTGFTAEEIEDLKAILDVEGDGESGKDTLNQLLELARYKNLEKEGRLIESPCRNVAYRR